MLHIRNTLHKLKYLENGTLSRLLTFTVVFNEWFYTQNVHRYMAKRSSTYRTRRCRKSHFVVLLSPSVRVTRYYVKFIPFFRYQPVPLTVAQLSDAFVLSLVHGLSSKTTKQSRHILCTGGHQQLANIILCLQATAENLFTSRCLATRNTQLQLYLSFLVALLSTCVSLLLQLNTWTTRSTVTVDSHAQNQRGLLALLTDWLCQS